MSGMSTRKKSIMNPNNSNKKWAIICVCIYIVSVIALTIKSGCLTDESLFHGDPVQYAKAMEGTTVNTWLSALYFHEWHFFRYIAQTLFNVDVSGKMCVRLSAILSLTLIVLSTSNWLYRLIHYRKFYILFTPVLLTGLLLLVCFSKVLGSIDVPFFAVSCLAMTVASYMRSIKDKSVMVKIFMWLVMLIFVAHMLSFRKNSLLIAPFIIYWSLVDCAIIVNRWKSMIVAGFLAGGLYLGANNLIPAEKGHPSFPMLISDMKNVDLLLGKTYGKGNVYTEILHAEHNSIVAGCIRRGVTHEEYSRIQKEYFSYWREHTKEMLVASAIIRVQFFRQRHLPQWMKDLIEGWYPEIKKNPEAWVDEQPVVVLPYAFEYKARNIVFAVSALLLAGWGIFRKRIKSDEFNMSFRMMAIGVVSAMSFLVVTPCCSGRYLIAGSMLCLWSMGFMGIELFRTIVCRNNK